MVLDVKMPTSVRLPARRMSVLPTPGTAKLSQPPCGCLRVGDTRSIENERTGVNCSPQTEAASDPADGVLTYIRTAQSEDVHARRQLELVISSP